MYLCCVESYYEGIEFIGCLLFSHSQSYASCGTIIKIVSKKTTMYVMCRLCTKDYKLHVACVCVCVFVCVVNGLCCVT